MAVVALVFGLALSSGCSKRSTETSASATDTTGTTARLQAENEIDLHLAAARAHIDSLRTDASRVGANLDTVVKLRLGQVEAARDTAEQRLNRLRHATAEQWASLRAATTATVESLDAKIDRLRAGLTHRSR